MEAVCGCIHRCCYNISLWMPAAWSLLVICRVQDASAAPLALARTRRGLLLLSRGQPGCHECCWGAMQGDRVRFICCMKVA